MSIDEKALEWLDKKLEPQQTEDEETEEPSTPTPIEETEKFSIVRNTETGEILLVNHTDEQMLVHRIEGVNLEKVIEPRSLIRVPNYWGDQTDFLDVHIGIIKRRDQNE